jgi:serine/threonine protein kinase
MGARVNEKVPEQLIGRYQLIRRLAVGGMAEIFLARATGIEGFEKLVVLKKILDHNATNEEFVAMFLDEARLAATLHHANIAQVYDIGSEDGRYFFTMEYVEGKDLRHIRKALRRTNQVLPLEHALGIVLGVAAGLHAAHEKRDAKGQPLNIVHRDVSPSNVIVTYDGGVKLIDFGIAKAAQRQAHTRTGILKGKAAYMSPEQWQGLAIDRRSDVFALGILLYELTTGIRLFTPGAEYESMRQVVKGRSPLAGRRPKDYPDRLFAIVERTLRGKPRARYQSCQQLFLDLEEFVRDQRIAVSPYGLASYLAGLFPQQGPPQVCPESPFSGQPDTDPVLHHLRANSPRHRVVRMTAEYEFPSEPELAVGDDTVQMSSGEITTGEFVGGRDLVKSALQDTMPSGLHFDGLEVTGADDELDPPTIDFDAEGAQRRVERKTESVVIEFSAGDELPLARADSEVVATSVRDYALVASRDRPITLPLPQAMLPIPDTLVGNRQRHTRPRRAWWAVAAAASLALAGGTAGGFLYGLGSAATPPPQPVGRWHPHPVGPELTGVAQAFRTEPVLATAAAGPGPYSGIDDMAPAPQQPAAALVPAVKLPSAGDRTGDAPARRQLQTADSADAKQESAGSSTTPALGAADVRLSADTAAPAAVSKPTPRPVGLSADEVGAAAVPPAPAAGDDQGSSGDKPKAKDKPPARPANAGSADVDPRTRKLEPTPATPVREESKKKNLVQPPSAAEPPPPGREPGSQQPAAPASQAAGATG